jgi:hypothetical protein
MEFHMDHSIVEISEDVSGWKELTDQLHTLVPGSTRWEQWYMKVVQSPFEANVTKIYDRTEKR